VSGDTELRCESEREAEHYGDHRTRLASEGHEGDDPSGDEPSGDEPGEGEGDEPADHEGDEPGDHEGDEPGDQEGDEPGAGDEDEPGDDANDDEHACPDGALHAGARVHEAELRLTRSGLLFTEIDLVL
jgi:hypothetical protein